MTLLRLRRHLRIMWLVLYVERPQREINKYVESIARQRRGEPCWPLRRSRFR